MKRRERNIAQSKQTHACKPGIGARKFDRSIKAVNGFGVLRGVDQRRAQVIPDWTLCEHIVDGMRNVKRFRIALNCARQIASVSEDDPVKSKRLSKFCPITQNARKRDSVRYWFKTGKRLPRNVKVLRNTKQSLDARLRSEISWQLTKRAVRVGKKQRCLRIRSR